MDMGVDMDPDIGTIFFSVLTETNRNSICFGFVSVFFAKLKKNSVCFGVSELFENEPKQK
jgi:hypothetical protein